MEASKFVLKVTAGPAYEQQREIEVNTIKPHLISSEHIDARLHVRVRDFKGLPKSSPSSSYFDHPSRNSARYSLEFSFTLPSTTSSDHIVFGNDFDHPIRNRLPPLFNQAFKYVKSWIDPGLYGEPEADEPYLYGPALSSVQIFRIGKKQSLSQQDKELNGSDKQDITPKASSSSVVGDSDLAYGDESGDDVQADVLTEGADDAEAEQIREKHSIPPDGPTRQKHFLNEEHRKSFNFEEGRIYKCDFFNGYLDFNDFSLKLPLGLSINVVKQWDGQPLRYVLRNRNTGRLLFVVSFTLVPTDAEGKEQMEQQTGKTLESLKEIEAAQGHNPSQQNSDSDSKKQNSQSNDDWDVD